jgi:hypothetical protein
MSNVQTQFNKVNPFTGEKVEKISKIAKAKYVPAEKLVIASDPLPEGRAKVTNKYQEVFDKLEYGQCVICEPDDVIRVSKAMRVWMDKNYMKGQVRSAKHYEKDGKGRVWLMAENTVQ